MKKLILALMGRPNVGKSTLFNRLVGKRLAIVDDRPGVTRDWRELDGQLSDLEFTVLDTAGLDPLGHESKSEETLAKLMTDQSLRAADFADILLLIIDGRVGIHPLDEKIATQLRRSGKKVLLVVNKCEGAKGEQRAMEAYRLGLGEPIPISAEHGEGMAGLYQALAPSFIPYQAAKAKEKLLADEAKWQKEEEAKRLAAEPIPLDDLDHDEMPSEDLEDENLPTQEEIEILVSPLKLAIVGRPNVGKSTLVNQLVGSKRVLTGPMAGLTRDAIYVDANYKGQKLRLVDTAGLRRKSKVVDNLEKASTSSTRQAIELCELVVLMISAEEGLEKQDLHIAGTVLDEGRGLIIVVNKADLVQDKQALLAQVQDRLTLSLSQGRDVPIILVSAEKGWNIDQLIAAAFKQREIWLKRLPTAKLNEWMKHILLRHPPPAISGRRPKPRYISQIKTRPPTFALFGSRVNMLHDSWQRYLINRLRDDFELPGVPIRLILKATDNPYHDKKKF